MPVPPIPSSRPGSNNGCSFSLGISQNQSSPGLTLQDMIDAYNAAPDTTKTAFLQTMHVPAALNPGGFYDAFQHSTGDEAVAFVALEFYYAFQYGLLTTDFKVLQQCVTPYMYFDMPVQGRFVLNGGAQEECVVNGPVNFGTVIARRCATELSGQFPGGSQELELDTAILETSDGNHNNLQWTQWVTDALVALFACCNPCGDINALNQTAFQDVEGFRKVENFIDIDTVYISNVTQQFPLTTEFSAPNGAPALDVLVKAGYFAWVTREGDYLQLQYINHVEDRFDVPDLPCLEITGFAVWLQPGVKCNIFVAPRSEWNVRRPNQLNSPID